MFRNADGPFAPRYGIGTYFLLLLSDDAWIVRRVDTIEFPSDDTSRRRITVDIDATRLWATRLDQRVLKDPNFRPAPVAFLRKELLLSLDVQVVGTSVTGVPPRRHNAVAAANVLCTVARDVLGVPTLPQAVVDRCFEIAHGNPEADETPDDDYLWFEDVQGFATAALRRAWAALMGDVEFRRMCREFYFQFMLLLNVPRDPTLALAKFSFDEPIDFTSRWRDTWLDELALKETTFWVPTTALRARSYHLRVHAPDDVVFTDVVPVGADVRMQVRIALRQVHLQCGHPRRLNDTIFLIPAWVAPRALLTPALVAAHLVALQLATLLVFQDRLGPDTEAAVAFLLTLPGALMTYLLRPGRPAVAWKLLRTLRRVLFLVGLLPLVAAFSILLGFAHLALWATLCLPFAVALGVVAVLLLAHRRSLGTIRAATERRGTWTT